MGNETSSFSNNPGRGNQIIAVSYYQWISLTAMGLGDVIINEEKQTPFTKKWYLKIDEDPQNILKELKLVFCFVPASNAPVSTNPALANVVKIGDLVELVSAQFDGSLSARPSALNFLELGTSAAKERARAATPTPPALNESVNQVFRVASCGDQLPDGHPVAMGVDQLSFESVKKPCHFCSLQDGYVKLVKRPQGPEQHGLVVTPAKLNCKLPVPLTAAVKSDDISLSSAMASVLLDQPGASSSSTSTSTGSSSFATKAGAATSTAVAGAAQKRYEKNPEKLASDAKTAVRVGSAVAGNKRAQKIGGFLLKGVIQGAAAAAKK